MRSGFGKFWGFFGRLCKDLLVREGISFFSGFSVFGYIREE